MPAASTRRILTCALLVVVLILLISIPLAFAHDNNGGGGGGGGGEDKQYDGILDNYENLNKFLAKALDFETKEERDAARYIKFKMGERPKFGSMFLTLLATEEVHKRAHREGAGWIISEAGSIETIVAWDLFDVEEYDNLTVADMEFLMEDYNTLGGLVAEPENYADHEFWKKHPQLFPFVRSMTEEGEARFYMKKLERLYEVTLEKEREERRSSVTLMGEKANLVGTRSKIMEVEEGKEDESTPSSQGVRQKQAKDDEDYKNSPEFRAKVEAQRKKTKEELFDEVRVTMKNRDINITTDVPPYLWTLSRIRVLREVEYYYRAKTEVGRYRWSDRLVLEIFYLTIKGKNQDAMSSLYGWMDDDVHHCDWDGITCGLTTAGEGVGTGEVVLNTDPRCYQGCDVNGYNCPHGLFKVEPRGSSLQEGSARAKRPKTIYCREYRPDPPEDAVTKIDLISLNLQGTLTPYLSHLQWLHRLNLFDNKIQGTIPKLFGHFYLLHFIDLGSNNIQGTIPTKLGRLTETLSELWLESNQLSGTLPSELAKLTVKFIDVSNNHLTGPIPTEYSSMVNLGTFRAKDNYLEGNIPTEWPLPIKFLDLSSNKFVGSIPSELGEATHMTELSLSSNSLTGPIPTEIFSNMNMLRTLWLDNNSLSSTLPSQESVWSGCPNLVHIELQRNKLEGTLPREMFVAQGKSDKLESIDFSHNRLTGSLPSELSYLSSLRKLNLAYNNLQSTIPPELGDLKLLEFNISANALTGAVPKSVCGETKKERWSQLWVACDSVACPPGSFHPDGATNYHGSCVKCPDAPNEGKSITDAGVVPRNKRLGQTTCDSATYEIGDLNGDGVVYEHEALRLIWLSTNGMHWSERFANWDDRANTKKCQLAGVTCAGGHVIKLDLKGANLCSPEPDGLVEEESTCWGLPSQIGVLGHLESLDLSNNEHFDGTIPKEIAALEQLKVLEISRCPSLKGTIPTALGKLKNLRTLNLSECKWSGQIPTELTQLTSLERLNLGLNHHLSGPLPDNIGDMRSIREILLSRMNLSSTLPSSLGDLTSLENLELYSNRFVGEIPNLSKNKNLKRIDVFNNLISGTFPFSLANLPMLQIVHLKNNRIAGTLPSELGSLGMLSWLDVGMNQLVGEIPGTFASLKNLRDLRLGGNMLSDPIPEGLCSSTKVNGGLAKHCGCDAIICGLGTYSSTGFAPNKEGCTKCPEGETTQFIGSTACRHFTQRDYLSMLYDAVGADKWWPEERRRGWKDEKLSECEWEGVTCDENGEVSDLSIPVANPARCSGEDDGWAEAYATRTVHTDEEPKFILHEHLTEPSPEIDEFLKSSWGR